MKYIEPEYIKYYIILDIKEFKRATHFTRIPSTNSSPGWEDVIYLKETVVDPSGGLRKVEYVYILVNNSMPGMVKIGMTTKSPHERAKEISKATGIPTPWYVVWYFKCYAAGILEKRVHNHLSHYRVSNDREMFRIDSNTAQNVIENLGASFSNLLMINEIENKK